MYQPPCYTLIYTCLCRFASFTEWLPGFWIMEYAVFHRLSQHCEPIHWSQVALITKDKFSEHKTLHPDQMPLKYVSWAPCCPLQTVVASKWLQSLWNNLQLHLVEGLFSLQESCNCTHNCLPGQQPLPSFFPLQPILIWGRLIPLIWQQIMQILSQKLSCPLWVCSSFITRLNLADPQDMVLIECKFELVFWHFLTSPGQLSLFITTVLLQLMCPEFSRLSVELIYLPHYWWAEPTLCTRYWGG